MHMPIHIHNTHTTYIYIYIYIYILPSTEEELAESSYLARLLDTPPRPDHPRAQTLRSARAAPAAAGAPAAAEGAAEQPAKKRRRKPKPWLDEKTEIPRDEYHDTTAITRYPLYEYDLTLPHRHPNIGLTTTFGDLCPMLCELFLRAPVVGEKRRRACADSMEAAAAPAAATPGAPEQPASRAGTSRRVAVTPGSSPGAPSPGAPSSLGAPSPGALPSPAAPAAPSVPVSPGMAYPSPEMPGAPPSPPGPPSPFEPMQVDVDMGPWLETPTGAEMDVDMGAESTGRQLVLREDTPPPVQRQARAPAPARAQPFCARSNRTCWHTSFSSQPCRACRRSAHTLQTDARPCA